jgi:ribonuclease J
MKKLAFLQNPESIYFIPLGGCNEIGMNFNLYYKDGKWIVIDCGIGFASESIPGVDIIVPDYKFISDNNIKIDALILTHIHEDHVGAIAHLWEGIGRPKIYATPLGREFVLHKFADIKIRDKPEIITIHGEMRKINIGTFAIEFVGLTHSVPEMKAIVLDSPWGKIVHTGDWKFDNSPVVGQESDYKRLKELGKDGVHTILCDSTNISQEGFSGSEGDLEKSMIKLVKEQKGRVIISTFASNLARVQTICNVAQKTGRKLVLSGFSLRRITDIGLKIGYFQNCPEFLDQKDASGLKPEQTLILCTGCQGEERASLSKIASKEHPHIKLNKGDSVIFSSKIIPGNEKSIYELFNKFVQRDINIFTERDHQVHVSGHPNRGELKKMYSLLKPKNLIPVHGEQYHIMEHCEFGKSLGMNSMRPKNGDVIEIGKDGVKKVDSVYSGYLCVDGTRFENIESSIFKERKAIAYGGMISCVCIVTSAGKLTCQPIIEHYGVFDSKKQEEIKEFQKGLRSEIAELLVNFENISQSKKAIERTIDNTIAKSMKYSHGKIPFINVIFHVI